jgi:hypothetical protein
LRPTFHSLRTLTTLLLASVLAAWSLAAIIMGASAAPYRALAERLEAKSDDLNDTQRIARIEQALPGSNDLSLCPREMVRSAVSIRLAIVDASYRRDTPGSQRAALAHARDALVQGLRCFPRDGNFWLRLAMVEFASSGASSRVAAMVQHSLATAPSEAWVIVPRIEFTSELLAARLPGAEAVLQADSAVFARYGQISEIADLYARSREPSRAILQDAFARLDKDRQAAIAYAVEKRASQSRSDQ